MSNHNLDQITNQVKAWAANRQLYPGWIIAPYQSRNALWSRTKWWIQPILTCLPQITLAQRVTVLDELNWRLETALLPLFYDIADAVRKCLEEFNPFPGAIQLPTPAVTPGGANAASLNWANVSKTWLHLALAYIRFHREERQYVEFDRWCGMIAAVVKDYPEEFHRLSYERCLAALGNMDDVSVSAVLETWPVDAEDQAWALRRAAVLAELGRLREAELLSESAIHALRAQNTVDRNDIPNSSREGWAMVLHAGLKQYYQFATQAGDTPDYSGRWEQFRESRCNPQVELEMLENKLEQPAPRPRQQPVVRPGFQPGIVTLSYRGGSNDSDKVLPAYQFMRLSEEAGFPPRCGNITLSETNLRRTAEWFAANDSVRTLTLICRLASKEVIESYLTRQRVAALPKPIVEELTATAVRAIEYAVRRVQTLTEGPESGLGERANRQLQAGIEILARMAVRLSAERLNELLSLALNLYKSVVVRNSITLPGTLRELFGSLILAMRDDDFNARFLEVLALPVPGSDSFPVALAQRWPQPVWELGGRTLRIVRDRRSEQWRQAVAHLLGAASSNRWEVRLHALASLLRLEEWGCLTASEVQRLVRTLWARVSQRTGLPEMPGLLNVTHLSLPEPKKGKVSELYRKYLTNGDLLRFCQQTAGPTGAMQRVFTMYSNPDEYILDWLGATATPGATIALPKRRFINWSRADATLLFKKLRSWWQEEGRELVSASGVSPFTGQISDDICRQRMNYILEALELIVIPRAVVGSRLGSEIVELVNDIDARQVPVERILPALLRLKPDAEKATASRLRRSFATSDEQRQRAALAGLTSWLRNQVDSSVATKGYQLPRVPDDLLQELGARVANRRQPGLGLVLETAVVVLRGFRERVNLRFIRALTIGLEYLLVETQYRLDDESTDQIAAADIPMYRMRGAQIAGLLARMPHGRSDVVQKWLEAARDDPLPEIRHAIDIPS
jgi:hypothetical protein